VRRFDLARDHTHYIAITTRLGQRAGKTSVRRAQAHKDGRHNPGCDEHSILPSARPLPMARIEATPFGDQRDDGWRQAFERLIQQQQFRIKRQCTGDRHHFALAAG
jgi:hypothetical protein